MFEIVKFTGTDEVEIVNVAWMSSDGEICYWPPFKGQKVKQLLLSGSKPDVTWKTFTVKSLGKYVSYDKAREKLRLAEETSNLDTEQSDSEGRPAKRFRARKASSSSSDDGDSILTSFHGSKKRKTQCISPPSPPDINYPQKISETHQTRETPLLHQTDLQEMQNSNFNVPELSPFEKEVIKRLEDMRRTLQDLNKRVESISLQKSTATASDDPSILETFPELPLTNLQKFEEWELFLEDVKNFKRAVLFLKTKGGASLGEGIRRMLQAMLTYELACNFNWAGKGGKQPFKITKTKTLICFAWKGFESDIALQGSEADIERIVKSFLKYAPDRVKYAKKKVGL